MSTKKPLAGTSRKPKAPPAASAEPAAAAPMSSLPVTFPDAVAAAPQPTNARERILYAAVFLLNEEGFSALTQTRVAEHAGMRQSHVTYYFPSRNDLLRETAVYGCNAMLAIMDKGIESGALKLENFFDFLIADVSDRRFARLMTALIVASDEDQSIKPWLASFEEANRDKLKQSFSRLGLEITDEDIELFHAAYVGAVILDLGEASDESLARSQRIVRTAFTLFSARSTNAKKPARPVADKSRKSST